MAASPGPVPPYGGAGAPAAGYPAAAGAASGSTAAPAVAPTVPVAQTSSFEKKIGQVTLPDGRKMDVFILLKDDNDQEMAFPEPFTHTAMIAELCQKIITELNPPATAKDITIDDRGLHYNLDSTPTTRQTKDHTIHDKSRFWWNKTIHILKGGEPDSYSEVSFSG